MHTYAIVIFYLLFGCPQSNFGSLSRGYSHFIFIIFDSVITRNLVVTRFSKLEMDCKQNHRHIGWLTHKQIDEHKKWKSKKTSTVCCQYWSPRYIVFVLSSRCGGCYPKGIIVASSYKIKQIIIIITIIGISTNITFICQIQFSF